ncbi:lipoprotein insertase outer membrane protein LolB [Moritella sp.]|uniref:lipoprotein insertase outer membrane protein LolB n=1 Tax=Moritella sp. TaxID=78556 RepID=UPI001D46156A|nr:lipoprotein insertase outer membrane protein LolB [Moritella sp.]MCJ8351135.1 lipoprotein insertase outer membrane protein LolB [Moritella sp.]NQZ41577.1 outer membrane lipoprotein LolB [Moritella sp.]
MTFQRSIYILIVSILLSACSTTTQRQPPAGNPQQLWQQHQIQLQTIRTWQLQGQIAFISPNSRNSATLNWQQFVNDFNINLTGPFGIHILTIKRRDNISTLILDDDRQYQGHNTQTLINQLSPIPIPVNELRAWIIGDPLTDDVQLDNYGRVTQANHPLGWHISYTKYQRVDNIWLPKNIIIKQADMRIKITTRNWKLNATQD